jgi:hypothetical protein
MIVLIARPVAKNTGNGLVDPRRKKLAKLSMQGDQIGRNSPKWVIVYYGQLLENNRSSPHYCGTYVNARLIMTKNGLGNILGDFFTNSSGHPASIQV